ncbi:MAG: dihydropteroate synthase [Chloroflexota bacterium]|nr:dihydropteroate synthase [Chloroflexota bacterium]
MIPAADLVAPSLIIGPRTFVWGARTYIMGVVNCSPESFSGDGVRDADEALALAHRMAAEGADLLDIGGQSTRPGAEKSEAGFDEISADEEIRRTAPVIERVRAELPAVSISIDTYKPEVARAALRAGAHLINDITGFRRDPTLARIVAEAGIPAVIMHNQRGRHSDDVIAGITEGLRESLTIAGDAGVPHERLIIDPGFGFGWKPEENIEMLRRLGELRTLRLPLLIGTSRKSTIGTVLGGGSIEDRIWGTAATVALAIAAGADIVRVHDVAAMKRVALMADAVVRGWPREEQ